jgi:hypothetical protein
VNALGQLTRPGLSHEDLKTPESSPMQSFGELIWALGFRVFRDSGTTENLSGQAELTQTIPPTSSESGSLVVFKPRPGCSVTAEGRSTLDDGGSACRKLSPRKEDRFWLVRDSTSHLERRFTARIRWVVCGATQHEEAHDSERSETLRSP